MVVGIHIFSRIFNDKNSHRFRFFEVYLILESVLKAYDRGVFNGENEEIRCPMEREKVVIYLQILRPLYLQSLAFQSNNSTIADIIPG